MSSSSTSTSTIGRTLFRWRSLTPIPVIVLIAYLLYRSRGHDTPLALLIAGALTSLAGQLLRFYTLAQARDGTSGQDDVLEARALNTRGPYAHVRNPLYVGNLLICAGLMLGANDVLAAAVGLTFFFGEYFFIIRAEEAFLRGQHGAQYEQYLRDVPRWVPRFTAAYPGRLNDRFDWRRALKKEHNPFTAWSLGFIALIAWERLARGAAFQSLWPLAALAAAVLVFFAAVKTWKRGWLSKA
ncbi:MAG: isoprenylcysteine carboxylmethyltransferase family protein [Myxococcaceae bacterium]|nr:isoprenylcysteine carboxylmethyltransferase family protein [Myxococcaceae bacterium]